MHLDGQRQPTVPTSPQQLHGKVDCEIPAGCLPYINPARLCGLSVDRSAQEAQFVALLLHSVV